MMMKKVDLATIKLDEDQPDSLLSAPTANTFRALIRVTLLVVVVCLRMSWKALLHPVPIFTFSTTPNSHLPLVRFLICCILLPLVCGLKKDVTAHFV